MTPPCMEYTSCLLCPFWLHKIINSPLIKWYDKQLAACDNKSNLPESITGSQHRPRRKQQHRGNDELISMLSSSVHAWVQDTLVSLIGKIISLCNLCVGGWGNYSEVGLRHVRNVVKVVVFLCGECCHFSTQLHCHTGTSPTITSGTYMCTLQSQAFHANTPCNNAIGDAAVLFEWFFFYRVKPQ